MIFPTSPRVVYKKNPLEQVICQIRFPSVLKIESQVPFEFQEIIREDYPLFSETTELPMELPKEITDQIPNNVRNAISFPIISRKNYKFSTDDEKWSINLTSEFIALTCLEYTRWEQFRKHLELPLNAVIQVYNPPFYSRMGLRYINAIRRSALDLEDMSWSTIVQPYIAGVLAAPEINQTVVKASLSQTEIRLENDTTVKMVYGLGKYNQTEEDIYVIDNDFFKTGRLEVKKGYEILNQFNNYSGNLFRWCITETLHEAMQPQSLSNND